MAQPSIQVLPDSAAVAAAAADEIIRCADAAIRQKQLFTIALSGGNTPKPLFELLASTSYARRINWKGWEVYFSDERCVGPDDPQSNYRMARLALLDHVPLDKSKIHRMVGEIDPQQAAKQYGELLKQKLGDG